MTENIIVTVCSNKMVLKAYMKSFMQCVSFIKHIIISVCVLNGLFLQLPLFCLVSISISDKTALMVERPVNYKLEWT